MRSWTLTALMCAVAVLFPVSPVHADPCGPQLYTDQVKEPNYDCPSPLEDVLVPNLPELPSVELKKGDAAPRGGILLDINRTLTLGLRIKALRRIRWMETTTAEKKVQAEIKYQQKVGEAKEKLLQSQVESYKGQLQNTQQELAKERKWYRSWSFGLVVGIVTTTAAALGVAYAASR